LSVEEISYARMAELQERRRIGKKQKFQLSIDEDDDAERRLEGSHMKRKEEARSYNTGKTVQT
jgi:hypothetical protein